MLPMPLLGLVPISSYRSTAARARFAIGDSYSGWEWKWEQELPPVSRCSILPTTCLCDR